MTGPESAPAALVDTLAANVRGIRDRIAAACGRAGRDPAGVRLVAVTKYVEADVVAALAAAGVADLAENRVNRLREKRTALETAGAGPVRWHMVGHLQRNKVRPALTCVDLLHSGDSLRLLDSLDAELARRGEARLEVLVQVNVGGEATKGGFEPEELQEALARVAERPRLEAVGLMTMAPATDREAVLRPVFRRLKEMRDDARDRGYLGVEELSMGMTGDFEIAVEEGATMVRIGRALFDGVIPRR